MFAADLPEDLSRYWPVPHNARSPSWRSPSRPERRRGRICPSWAVVALSDKAAGTDVVRSMAERAGATITEVEGSHVIMISQPDAVTDVIMNALAAVEAPAPVG